MTISGKHLELKAVSKSFGGAAAVDELSLDVPAGRFLTLLGPSGSGKSTCLRMIAGLETPSAGDVLLNGKSILETPVHRRNIGVVFQSYALFPHLSVFENVGYPLRMRGMGRAQASKRVMQSLELVRMTDFKDRLPKQLSGGQQQRVALARALVFEPDLLLLDEPLAALDKRLREAMQYEIRRLQESLKITTILVTHDQTEALVMSDQVAILDKGRLQQVGSPREIYQRPQNRFVAEFIGEANVLVGRFTGPAGSDRTHFETAEGFRLQVAGQRSGRDGVHLIIRPERIELGASPAGDVNCFAAAVLDRTLVGDTVRMNIQIGGAHRMVAKQLATDLDFQKHADVWAHIPPAACHTVAD